MAELEMPLCIHGEATDPSIDIFDREAFFVKHTLIPLHADLPDLKIIMEHITTKEGVEFVMNGGSNVGGTITPQHLMYNRNRPFTHRDSSCRALGRRNQAALLLSAHSEARGTPPGARVRHSVGLQTLLPGNGLGSARAREKGVCEGMRWLFQ